MELVDYLRMLRRQWVWVVGSVVVLTALATVYVMTSPKTYRATADVFVGSNVIGTTSPDNQAAQAASNYVFDRIDTYSTFVDYPQVLQPVIDELKLSTTASDLAKQVSSSVVPNTVVITVSATDASAAQAQKIANSAAKNLTTFIAATDTPVQGGASPVKPELKNLAALPAAPDSPNRNLMLALGILVGLALGLVIASLRDQLRRSRPARSASAVEQGAEPVASPSSAFEPPARKTPAPSAFQPPADEPDGDGSSASSSAKPATPTSLEAALASTQARTKRPERAEPISVPPADGPSSQR